MLAGFDVNETRGDAIRTELWHKTALVLESLDRLGVHTPNRSGFPIIEAPLARHEDIDAAGRFLFDQGIYVTLAAYPLVPKTEVGFRIQMTAANTQAEIEQLIEVLETREQVRSSSRPEYGICCVKRVARIDWRARAWVVYLVLGGLLTLAYVAFPPLMGNGPLINLLGLSSSIAIAIGIRIHAPRARAAWMLFIVGQFLFFAGDLYTYSYPKLFGAEVEFPSLGDGVY